MTAGEYRRRIVLEAGEWSIGAALEDDFHHFELRVRHDGRSVTGITSEAKRTPWSTCPSASALLTGLVGTALSSDVLTSLAGLNPRTQCTHQFDLALLAIAQGARGGCRRFDATVSDEVGGRRHASLAVDGTTVLDWMLEGSIVKTGSVMQGVNLRSLDMQSLAASDPATAEAVSVLRRAVMVASGRGIDFDLYDDMSQFAERMAGACYAFQPERIPLARRNKGSVRDFTLREDLLLHDVPKS